MFWGYKLYARNPSGIINNYVNEKQKGRQRNLLELDLAVKQYSVNISSSWWPIVDKVVRALTLVSHDLSTGPGYLGQIQFVHQRGDQAWKIQKLRKGQREEVCTLSSTLQI